ncbi:hypothetical protein QBC37DRAFT_294537 [Rhypophila decipiens]|uniref:Uncharacterized protein n=1 Tax=Rhypophila decipiens TaxID=261697 RepID=A0AAN6XYX0_9PEZI|nr:hypothetical protein QBC37DRAFT_294537 [Rhypophila decipiens]
MVNEPVLQDRSSIRVTTRDPPPPPRSRTKCQTSRGNISQRRWWHHIIVPPQHKENVLLSIALFLTMALLVLILYYENTISPDTKFEMFMNSQTFGVRILFTSLGTAATWFWDYYFSCTFYTRLFKQAHGKPEGEPARSSILLSPPTNVFLGIYHDNKKRRLGMIVHGLSIALVALLAKFTPILFANIPFRDTVTFRMHEVCTWLAVFVLGCMILVLCVSIWVNAMHEKITLPVMPDTIVGGMYYLAGAGMLRDFDSMGLRGVSAKTRKRERDRIVSSMQRMYGFGELQIKQVLREDQQDIDHITFKGENKRLRRLGVDYI